MAEDMLCKLSNAKLVFGTSNQGIRMVLLVASKDIGIGEEIILQSYTCRLCAEKMLHDEKNIKVRVYD
jgi:hypothetical protein